MDEFSIVWGPIMAGVPVSAPGCSTHRTTHSRQESGRAHLERAGRTVTGLRLTILHGCRLCGSIEHGAPYFANGWSAYVGCSLTYVRGFALAVLSLRRRHTDDHGLLRGPLPVGIDAELADNGGGLGEDVARRLLSAQEATDFARLSHRDASGALLRAWTVKEAVLKASGRGLSIDPRRVSTSIGTSMASLDVAGRTQRFHVWHPHPNGFPQPWMVSVATADTVRAHLATFRLLPEEG